MYWEHCAGVGTKVLDIWFGESVGYGAIFKLVIWVGYL